MLDKILHCFLYHSNLIVYQSLCYEVMEQHFSKHTTLTVSVTTSANYASSLMLLLLKKHSHEED